MTVTIKLRSDTDRPELFNPIIAKVFDGVSHTVVHAQPLVELLASADIAISCYSTAAIEVLACGVPLINLALSPAEKMMGTYHFAPYAAAGAMEIANTQEQFEEVLRRMATEPQKRVKVVSKAGIFMEKNFLFDGHASERAAALVEALAKK
jgi:UDP-N-acetylglucosamine:LPS N-acetylglucosamine transferase